MKNLKLLGLSSIVMAVMGTSSVMAATYDIADHNANSYWGEGGNSDFLYENSYPQKDMEIYGMNVSRENGIMTVRIFTNVVNHIGDLHSGNGLRYGDLFMSVQSNGDSSAWTPYTNGSDNYKNDSSDNTTWEYAYNLSDYTSKREHDGFIDEDTWDYSNLVLIDDPDNAGQSATYKDQLYRIGNNDGTKIGHKTDTVEVSKSGNYNESPNNYIEFIFDVSNTVLGSASQIAFSWTTSLGKDAIAGLKDFGGTTTGGTVPEPAALGLMLAGLAGFGLARRRKILGL